MVEEDWGWMLASSLSLDPGVGENFAFLAVMSDQSRVRRKFARSRVEVGVYATILTGVHDGPEGRACGDDALRGISKSCERGSMLQCKTKSCNARRGCTHHRQRPPRLKVLRHHRHGRPEDEHEPEAHAHALGEEDLG